MRSITMTAFRGEFLALHSPPLRAAATRSKYRQVLDELSAVPGARRTSDLTPATIGAWVAGRMRTRRPATRLSLLRAARTVCRYAVATGRLASDPFAWRPPARWLPVGDRDSAEVVRIDRHLAAASVARVLAQADAEAAAGDWRAGRLRALVYLAAYTGLRAREALGLATADVDLGSGVLLVRPNARRALKTAGSAAPLAIAPALAEVLAEWLPRTGGEWVLPGTRRAGPWLHGGPGRRPIDQVRALGERAGVRGLTLLAFRHTLATLAEPLGLGELELQRWLRHSSPRTQRGYRHADLESLRLTAAKIYYPPCRVAS